MSEHNTPRRFMWCIVVLGAVIVLLGAIFPRLFQWVSSNQQPIPTPVTLWMWFIMLTIAGLMIYSTVNDRWIEEIFLFFAPDSHDRLGTILRNIFCVAFPLIVLVLSYRWFGPRMESPVELRVQHPTSASSAKYANMENPLRKASAQEQQEYVKEGRVLFQQNCRPCHGSKGDGRGPFAEAYRLRPINFTDPGTIATLVEGVAFWRIKEGGPGLPDESSPWDSAMPAWEDHLTDEQIWKVIMGMYSIANVEPRNPEKIHN